MINLQKNREKAEKELAKLKFQDDIEDCRAYFDALIVEKENDPLYKEIIAKYWDEKPRVDGALWKQQLHQEDVDFDTLMWDTGCITENLRKIEDDIIEIRLREIMREES